MKFLIMEPSLFPILLPFVPKYSPQDPVFEHPYSLHFSLNVRDHASQPYSTTGNIIVLYILIFKFLLLLLLLLYFRLFYHPRIKIY